MLIRGDPLSATEFEFLHQFFEEAVRRCPDGVAIDVPPATGRPERRLVSYASLQRLADSLAHWLLDHVVGEDRIVVILIPRACEHLYAAQLAVLKAGAAFTCIDPSFPDEQVRTILMDSQAVAILTDGAGAARLNRIRPAIPVLDVVSRGEQVSESVAPLTNPRWLTSSCLAYLIYTSGTTGQPKGVMIEHRSIVNLVRGDLQTLRVTPQDRVAQNSSPAYDSSIEETWFALAAGATVVVMDNEAARLGPDLVPWLRRERITMFCPAPTLLRSTGCENPERQLPDLRMVHPGGEALTQDVADRWAPGRRLLNDYGPTETTVTALRCHIQPGRAISIGQPVPGMYAWVLDENLQEVAHGKHGELCIGGVGLARGYHNEPELTSLKFPLHPQLGRIYRTGDLASRDDQGNFYCHGRIDAQVKVRGYRIELEAIEARLVECAGVREAACTVQGEGAHKKVVGFVVPEIESAPPSLEALRSHLRKVLPDYMVPVRIGLIPELPRNTSAKLNRQALPVLEPREYEQPDELTAPRNAVEEKLMIALQTVFQTSGVLSVHDDFFYDLGGDSLLAASLISLLRQDPETASLTVRDVYESRTIAELAKRLRQGTTAPENHAFLPGSRRTASRPKGQPIIATVLQTLGLLVGVIVTAPLTYMVTLRVLPGVPGAVGIVPFLILLPVFYIAGLLAYTALTITAAVLLKKLLIGHYRPISVPAWGSLYVRNWIVQRCVRLVPWRLIEITEFQNLVLRALGARIGKRVHLHRGVNLTQGGWDLLEIGDDVTVGQDATLQIVTLEDGQVVFGCIALHSGATLEVRAGVGRNTTVGSNSILKAWSFLGPDSHIPDNETWDGVPAKQQGRAPAAPAPDSNSRELTPILHGLALILGRLAVEGFVTLPVQMLALLFVWAGGVDGAVFFESFADPFSHAWVFLFELTLVFSTLPLTLMFELIALRLLGAVRPGVISRWSLAYVRVRLKVGIVESAGRWLCGTLLWPVWLRAAGMKIGRGCEISTIIDTIPELVEIGPETFFADGIHLAGPKVSRGTVRLEPVRLGTNVFLGNHAVVDSGLNIPDDVLIGVCTAADGPSIRKNSSWFGHPPFELHNRETVECDRAFTHDPSWPRYLNRVFWELLRFTLPLVPVLVAPPAYLFLERAAETVSFPVLLLAVIPAAEIAVFAILILFVLGLKWMLLGRVRPGTHPLWSCWCSRWDFLYVAWDFCASAPLAALEGTLLLNVYLRAMGMRIGRNVVLGPSFVHVVDPDMLEFQDGTTVSCLLQAHTFEDRVLKIDRVTVRRDATIGHVALLLYGCDIGEGTYVIPHSVVMKRERLLPDRVYGGCPTDVVSIPENTPSLISAD